MNYHKFRDRFELAAEEIFHGKRFDAHHEEGEPSLDDALAGLEDCEDIMPSSLCDTLDIESGNTYAIGVEVMRQKCAVETKS